MSAFEIRVVAPGEVGLLQSVSRCFGEAFEEPETYVGRPPSADYLRRLLASDTFLAIAALRDGVVIGGLVAYELRKFEQERSEIYIYDLAVASDQRRRGVATALIARVRHIGQQRGAHVVFVQADRGDEPAIALYTKLGTREDVLHFDIEVAEP